jgi:tetratricopeptide (TPR) repeat protein
LGLALYRLGEIHRELGDYAAAEEALTKAVELLGELVRSQPDVAEYQRELASSYAALGLVHAEAARWEKAEAAFEQALTIQEKQAAAYPQAAEYRYALAKTYRESGFMHHRLDRPDRATERYQQALDVLNKLVQDHPLAEHQSLLATTQMNLATVYLTRGWYDKVVTALKEAQRVYERLARGRPDIPPEYRQSLARSHAILGMAYRGQGQFEKAESALGQALEIFEKLAKEHPDVVEYSYDLGRCCGEWARLANSVGRPDDALVRFDKAIETLERVMARGYGAAQSTMLNDRIDRTSALVGKGDHARATAEADAVAQQGGLLSVHIYNIACVFSRASAAVDRDGKLSPAKRARLKVRYADRAMGLLRQAVAEGWRHPQAIKEDRDMEPLRAREDFQKLLAELEAKSKE